MLQVNVKKTLPDFSLNVSFGFDNGIMVLFGPSGAGKTTLLNCIAGLAVPDSGMIALGSKVFYSSNQKVNLPARNRNIGYVFQDYALFPHMTVKQNAMYGIKGCKGRDKRYRLTVLEVLDVLKITHLQERYPAQLSGGEKQRVALARALMTEPDLLLMDEPLSALDENVRTEIRRELKKLQKEWDIPFVLVTHSREDLDALADDVVFLSESRIFDEACQGVLEKPVTAKSVTAKVDNNPNFGII